MGGVHGDSSIKLFTAYQESREQTQQNDIRKESAQVIRGQHHCRVYGRQARPCWLEQRQGRGGVLAAEWKGEVCCGYSERKETSSILSRCAMDQFSPSKMWR